MKLSEYKKHGVIILTILAFSTILFGITGLKTIAAVLLFFELPFYIILRNWFNEDEAIFYSFFVGIGAYSAFVYHISFFTGIKTAIWTTFGLLVFFGIIIKRIHPNKNQGQTSQSQDSLKHEENLGQDQQPSDN